MTVQPSESMQAAAWICQTHGKQYCGQYPDAVSSCGCYLHHRVKN